MLHTKRTIARLIAIIALALLAVPAGATVTVQNTKADWQALTTGYFTTLVDFNGLAAGSPDYFTNYSTAAGLTLDDVTLVGFTSTVGAYNLKVQSPDGASANKWGSGDYLVGGYSPSYVLATLPLGTTAVGVDLGSNTRGKTVTVILSTADGSYTYSVGTSTSQILTFRGFVSDTPITSISFSAPSGFAEIDNFNYGFVCTPEPDGLFMAGAGLIGLWFARRLRRRCG
jgi:hypothetical protein